MAIRTIPLIRLLAKILLIFSCSCQHTNIAYPRKPHNHCSVLVLNNSYLSPLATRHLPIQERYMFSAERLKNKLLIPLKGDVPLDKIVDGYKLFLSNPKRKSFEEYKDIALVCGWYGEKKILDDILEYIWNNVQKDKNHPFFRNKDRGVEGWFEKIREESSDCERLHEICEKEIQKHKVGKLPYRNII